MPILYSLRQRQSSIFILIVRINNFRVLLIVLIKKQTHYLIMPVPRSLRQRRLIIPILRVQLGAFFKQQRRYSFISIPYSLRQWQSSIFILIVRINDFRVLLIILIKQTHYLIIPVLRSLRYRCPIIPILRVQLGAFFKQQRYYSFLSFLRGLREWRLSMFIFIVGINNFRVSLIILIKKQIYYLIMPILRSLRQRQSSFFILIVRINNFRVSLIVLIKKQTHYLIMPVLRSLKQR